MESFWWWNYFGATFGPAAIWHILMSLERLANIYEQTILTFLSPKYSIVKPMNYEYLPYRNGCHAVFLFYDWSFLNIPKPAFKVPECPHFWLYPRSYYTLTKRFKTYWYGHGSWDERKHAADLRAQRTDPQKPKYCPVKLWWMSCGKVMV